MQTLSTPGWRKVHDTLCAEGASPFWQPQEERLYWLDRGLNRLWRLHPRSGHADHQELPHTPGSVAPCRSGGLLLAMDNGLYLQPSWSDLPRLLQAAPFDSTQQRFGSGRCDPWGRFWVGTEMLTPDRADAGLHCLQTRNQLEPELALMDRGVLTSAGVAFAPDGRTVYWGDANRHHLSSHALADPGHWSHHGQPEQDYAGCPRACAMDQHGHLWVAMFEGGQVLRLDPQGHIVQRIPTPTPCPTGLCFGGEDRRTLYLTTARLHRHLDELAQFPDSGAVFALEVQTPGTPTALYWD